MDRLFKKRVHQNGGRSRALRHAVLGRKNFNGSKTINGADVAATLYSVIESCKKVQLDPVDYMKYVICENDSGRDPLTPMNRARQLRGIIDDTPLVGKRPCEGI